MISRDKYQEMIELFLVFIEELVLDLKEILHYQQNGDFNKAFASLAGVIDKFEIFIDSIITLGEIANCAEAGKEFADILTELLNAMENDDNVLIGDLIEYEIIPILERVKDNLADIK